jgi:PHD/YefM family antitoxin component YafN of YafNO toxin-antitoxin module
MENKDKNNKEELKKKLHELIDGIEDEHILKVLNEDVIAYMITTMDGDTNEDEDDEEDDLSDEQLKELDEAIAEVDRGETISFESYEEFKKNMEEWRASIKSAKVLK